MDLACRQGVGAFAKGLGFTWRTVSPVTGPRGEGRGATADELAGGRMPLDSDTPDKVIGSYWPYATTLFDFIARAMPLNAPKTLSPDQVYAVSAYLLYLNGLLAEDASLDAASLAAIRMPNRDGFVLIDAPSPRDPVEPQAAGSGLR